MKTTQKIIYTFTGHIFSIVETLEVSACLSNGDLKGFSKEQIMTGFGIV